MSLLGEGGYLVVGEKPGFGYACVRRLLVRYDMAPDCCLGHQTAD